MTTMLSASDHSIVFTTLRWQLIHNEKMKTYYNDYKDENLGYFITPEGPTFIINVLLTKV